MAIKLVSVKETVQDEKRIALVPQVVKQLQALGIEITLQRGFGEQAGYPDDCYADVKWLTEQTLPEHLVKADILLTVQMPPLAYLQQLKPQAILVGLLAPHNHVEAIQQLCHSQVTSFTLEWLPRITRAQSMDALSSQATVAGYQAVLIAAQISPRFFPMLTTAAGTIRPASVLIVGAGVAGLQAIATAKRLGAKVYAYDIRNDVKEQIASLGAQMIDLGFSAEGFGGYARELTIQEKQQQQTVLAEYIAKMDVIITTAAVPGKIAPQIVTQSMVEAMAPGSIIVDIAAEFGGNCELTRIDQQVNHHGVIISGPVHLASQVAQHASDMYSRNIAKFLELVIKKQTITLDWSDDILAVTQLTFAGRSRTSAQAATITTSVSEEDRL